jgi:hypothetical protein
MQLQQIKALGQALSPGESTRIICPFCQGGKSREVSFRIKNSNHKIEYNCFRAKCKESGDILTYGEAKRLDRRPSKVRPFTKDLVSLPEVIYEQLFAPYNLELEFVKSQGVKFIPEMHRAWLPILAPAGFQIGGTARACDDSQQPKAITYIDEDYPLGHFPILPQEGKQYAGKSLILLEDQISAMKVSLVNPCCALLGVAPQPGLDKLIISLSPAEIIIMFDGDEAGYGAAAKAGRRFSSFLPTRVVGTPRGYDPKDLSLKQIQQLTGV